MKIGIRTIGYVASQALFFPAMLLFFAPIWAVTLPFDWRRRRVAHILSRMWGWGICHLGSGWRIRVRGREYVRNKHRGEGYVVVANHQHLLDIPVIYSVIPFNMKWVSKREIYRMPFVGLVLRMNGDVAIDRGGTASTKRMVSRCGQYLHRGVSVAIFPEGTRNKTGRMGVFKEGAMRVALEAGCGILPVVIDGTGDAFKEGKLRAPHRFRVQILPPISARQVVDIGNVKELRERLFARMDAAHRDLLSSTW